jgi:hypothetical protein
MKSTVVAVAVALSVLILQPEQVQANPQRILNEIEWTFKKAAYEIKAVEAETEARLKRLELLAPNHQKVVEADSLAKKECSQNSGPKPENPRFLIEFKKWNLDCLALYLSVREQAIIAYNATGNPMYSNAAYLANEYIEINVDMVKKTNAALQVLQEQFQNQPTVKPSQRYTIPPLPVPPPQS